MRSLAYVDQASAKTLAKSILQFCASETLNKVCLHLVPKQVQNLWDLTAYGWTTISTMTPQCGTEAFNKQTTLNLHILKDWALTRNGGREGEGGGEERERELCLQ